MAEAHREGVLLFSAARCHSKENSLFLLPPPAPPAPPVPLPPLLLELLCPKILLYYNRIVGMLYIKVEPMVLERILCNEEPQQDISAQNLRGCLQRKNVWCPGNNNGN